MLFNKLNLRKHLPFLLILITLLAAIIRFWHFTSNPPSLYVDEVSHGYNAYSILKTGRDEYGTFMPFFFRAFNVYNPPLAVYTLVPTIALLGLNEISIRLPAVLFGTLFIPLSYFFILNLSKNKKLALLSAFFISISPWHIHFSRFYHEANFTVFFSTLAVTLFLLARNKPYLYILAALSFATATNYSHIGKIFVPLLILGSLIFIRINLRQNVKLIFFGTVILIISVLPHLLSLDKSLARGASISIINSKDESRTEKFIDGYLSHFSPKFLFNRGDYQGRHSVPGIGELYVFEIPFFIFGIYLLVKSKEKGYKFLLFWLLIAPIPAALTTPTPHAGRGLVIFPVLSVVSAIGLLHIFKNFKWYILLPLLPIALYSLITYFHLYHSHYPKEKAVDWADGYKDMALFVKSKYPDYERIAITRYWGHPYIYILFYLQFDPAKYHPQAEYKYAFDKFEFYLGAPEQSDKKTLFVSTAEHKDKILKEVKLNNGDLFFTVHE